MHIKNDWSKKGVIFNPSKVNDWIVSHAYIPTPVLLNEETIRIFLAFKDAKGIGRVGYIDVNAQNPFDVISISKMPSLDIGVPGTFDDNGVTPISIVNVDGKLYLYYAGWQLSDKVRYFLFVGLAISDNMGVTFTRVKKVPILERTDQEFLVRTAPCVLKEGKKWHMLYSGGNNTVKVDGKIIPSYSLKYLISEDGINWQGIPQDILIPEPGKEFGFGRPFYVFDEGVYKMWYSIRKFDKTYCVGYAESISLKDWTRKDSELYSFSNDLKVYEDEMQAFAAITRTKYGNYMFYNGNDFGKTGVCFAVQQ